jgi:hypothetical protein
LLLRLDQNRASKGAATAGYAVRFFRRLLETGQTASLKSFGRRRRTKVVDERTRGEQALVYGEFDF